MIEVDSSGQGRGTETVTETELLFVVVVWEKSMVLFLSNLDIAGKDGILLFSLFNSRISNTIHGIL